ncbi:MAG: TetR/AcrR family transcriptional regulator [Verrucomicrobia bacterium]|nr:TetR/AcrR family transcriptional regulator [Verrucomicrobiota bacterium]
MSTKERILEAALKRFALQGYAGASIRDIAAAAKVTKAVLYYYFADKADLYRALVDWASDKRLRLMREAVARKDTLPERLRELCATVFEFARTHRELMRLAFASALAAPGEAPAEAHCFEKGWQSFLFLQDLMEQGRREGALDRRFTSRALAMGFAGLMHLYVLLHLLQPDQPLDRSAAEAVADLFFSGAAVKEEAPPRQRPRRRGKTCSGKTCRKTDTA